MVTRRSIAKPVLFVLVGGIGFVIDAGILTYCMRELGFPVFPARLLSFGCASMATWGLNRRLAFRQDVDPGMRRSTEYVRYLLVQVGGALSNLLVFALMIAAFPSLLAVPAVPLAVGAVFGLLVNFSGAQLWVFRRWREGAHG